MHQANDGKKEGCADTPTGLIDGQHFHIHVMKDPDYNTRKVLRIFSTEGYGSTEPGDTYLSCFPDIYSNFSVIPVVIPHFLGRYFNACNATYNRNSRRQSGIPLEKYSVT